MQTASAQDISERVLLWLCTQQELLGVFLAASGADIDALRTGLQTGAADRALGNAALDFVMMRDETVLEAAAALDLPPDHLAQAAAVLAGESGMHWT